MFLKEILEDVVDRASQAMPYFVERCVMFVIRSACDFFSLDIDQDISLSSKLEGVRPHSVSQRSHGGDVHYVWLSLRLLRGLPVDLMCNISDRVGAALWSFIRSVVAPF